MNISTEISALENTLTNLWKDEIIRQNLVKSGKLLKTLKVSILQTSTGISIQVSAEDYFNYLDDKFNITRNVMRMPAYDEAMERFAKAYSTQLIEQLNKELDLD